MILAPPPRLRAAPLAAVGWMPSPQRPAVGVQDAHYHATQTGQPARLRVDALPAGLDQNRAAAADAEVEVQPVLHRFAPRYHLEPDPWPAACRIDDAVRADAQLNLGYS
jgi:hypothetical protein